ncbi:MAG: hypothetical protein HYR84_01035 [Planctomycetes bacterium]|nr:hypothetical protein [Planctomycetota bacterium]
MNRSNLIAAALAPFVVVTAANVCEAQDLAKLVGVVEKIDSRLSRIEDGQEALRQRLDALEAKYSSPGYSAPAYKPAPAYTPPSYSPPAYNPYANYSPQMATPFNQFSQGQGQCQVIGYGYYNGQLVRYIYCPPGQ